MSTNYKYYRTSDDKPIQVDSAIRDDLDRSSKEKAP